MIEPLTFRDLYWEHHSCSEGEMLDKKLDAIADKINEIVDYLNGKE